MERITSREPNDLVTLTEDELDYVTGGLLNGVQLGNVAALNGNSAFTIGSSNFNGNTAIGNSNVGGFGVG